MRVAAFMALHYGKDYMAYAMKSVLDQVDKFFVLYTARPSYGHMAKTNCPENERELKSIAEDVCKDKLVWNTIKHGHREGDHRNQIYAYMTNYDILATIDSDEVWEPSAFSEALKYISEHNAYSYGAHHSGWLNFWRSFNEICRDGFCPIRFNKLRGDRRQSDINCPSKIYHFGCAQRREIMDYKWQVHGHQDELRPNYLQDIYYGYQKGVTKWLHPVSLDIWHETEDFNKEQMPDFLKQHPYYNLDVIE